jgi:hypothetical protein
MGIQTNRFSDTSGSTDVYNRFSDTSGSTDVYTSVDLDVNNVQWSDQMM